MVDVSRRCCVLNFCQDSMLSQSDFFPSPRLLLFTRRQNVELIVKSNQNVSNDSLNEISLTSNRQRESQELPICLFHSFKRVVGDFHARWRVGSSGNPCNVNLAVADVVSVLEDRLVFGVPMSDWSFHVSNRLHIKKVKNESKINFNR